jgi:hypothetical protein
MRGRVRCPIHLPFRPSGQKMTMRSCYPA